MAAALESSKCSVILSHTSAKKWLVEQFFSPPYWLFLGLTWVLAYERTSLSSILLKKLVQEIFLHFDDSSGIFPLGMTVTCSTSQALGHLPDWTTLLKIVDIIGARVLMFSTSVETKRSPGTLDFGFCLYVFPVLQS